MKKFVLLLAIFVSTSLAYAESSEDIYSLDTACKLDLGLHMGQISSLEKDRRFSDVIIDSNYNIGTFHRLNDKLWGDSIFFVVNSNYVAGVQKYSELYLVNCSPHNLQVSHFPIHRIELEIQYSPEIMKITDRFILLDDWQNIHGMNIHVVTIFVRSSSKFYAVRD